MAMALPPQQEIYFREILFIITRTNNRIGTDKCHWVFGKLRATTIALHESQGLFSYIEEALRHIKVKRVTPTKGVHQALAHLFWLAQDLERCPTRL